MSLARRSLQVVAFLATLIVGVASMAIIVTQTAWFKEWLRGFIVRQAEDYVNGRLSIGRLDGNLFFGVELEDVDVTMNGKHVVEIKDAGLDYNVFTFIRGNVVLDDVRLNKPTIRLEKTADGWNITRLIKARTPDPDEPKTRRPIEIGEIGVTDGALELDGQPVGTSGVEVPNRVEKLNASIGIKSDEDALDVTIAHVSLRAEEPRLGINALSGRIVRTPNEVHLENVALRTEESSLRVNGTIHNIENGSTSVDLQASSDKLSIDEIARVVPALRGYSMQPAFQVTARGPANRMDVDLNAREKNLGTVSGDLIVDAMEPVRRVAGTVSMEHFNVGPVAKSATLKSDITGQARIDMALPSGQKPLSGTYVINASSVNVAGYAARDVKARGRIDGQIIRVNANAAAYGGRATAVGTVKTGTPLVVDLQGRAADLDLRNLPPQLNAPGVPSDLQFEYRLNGRGRVFSGDVRLDTSTLAGATIASGTTGTFSIGGGAPSYGASGSVSNLDIQQVGKGFGITALAADKFKSRLNAQFTVKGSGGGATAPLSLDASGVIADSELFGATVPRMDVATKIAGSDMQVRALGQFSGLNPAVVSGNEKVKGEVSGAVDVNATLRNYRSGVTPESIDASGRVNLGHSNVAGLAIDSAVIDGKYADRSGVINQIAVTGPDVNVQGKGTLALNETGASNMQLHVESSALDHVGEIVGRPLKGAALVDAELTGNAKELRADGTLKGSSLGYGANGALNLDTKFKVAVPHLVAEKAVVQADSHATFLEIGGQRITELTAKTTYSGSKLEFDANAQEGVRHVGAAGAVVFHPDHQEIHLGNFALRSEKVEWRSAPGSEAAVQYGSDRIAVQNMRLVSGDQTIEADGVIGSTTEPLKVRVQNVDVAQLDQLLLANSGMAGRLNAEAVIAGPKDALRADGKLALTQGAFREFKFEALTGDVKYTPGGVALDIRLQQNPQAWLTAKGSAPMSLFRATRTEERGRTGEPVDITIQTSQIDLGVIQGFTQYVTNATGTLQANVRVTGTGYDPEANGVIEIKGGTFAVPDLGTRYSGLDTRIDLKPDTINISEFKILDARGFPMTIGGSLGVNERRVGDVNIRIQAEKFELIDNSLADVKVNTNMRITGTPATPRVEGQVAIENGTIQVGEILDKTMSSAYRTTETEISNQPDAPVATTPTVFNALDLNVALEIPSNLVLKGTDLRPANAPISIGDVNVTVGGLVQVRKPRGENGVRILGEANTIRGNYDFQGRRFELLRDGRIRFQGSQEIDPLLDLRARREISGVETFIRVQGTMRQPELSFSSNPPLDEADILALIVFNQPVNELGTGQQASLAARAQALAGGYLASGLAQSIGNALELDQFEIEAQGDRGGPTLTVGEQVGEKLFFRIRQGFGAAQGTEFILEYQLADFLRFQGTAADLGGSSQRTMFRRVERGGLDIIFFFSY